MPKGPATTKTDFQRYLDDHPDAVPSLRPIAKNYASNPKNKHVFGFWLRMTRPTVFEEAYFGWWLKHPELFAKVYPEPAPFEPYRPLELAR